MKTQLTDWILEFQRANVDSGKTLLGRRGSYRGELTGVLYLGSCWGPLLGSYLLSQLNSTHQQVGVQIEKDLIDTVWIFWRDNEDALRLSLLPCNFAAWQIHMWGSTAEVEAFSAGRQVFCKMLETLLPCSHPHICWRKTFLGALIGTNCVGCSSEQFFQELKIASP